MAAEPYNRDALFNLANTYLALKDGPKLLATAQQAGRARAVSENVAQAGRAKATSRAGKVDDAVKTAEKVLALPVDVKVTDFATDGERRDLTATATGRRPRPRRASRSRRRR